MAARTRFRIHACYRQHRLVCPGTIPCALDLRSASDVHAALESINPRVVVHFAAATNVNHCEDHREETFASNVQTTRHLAEWAAEHGACMVYMSTDSVFDGNRGGYRETDTPAPLNYYATTKLMGEEVVRNASVNHLIVRANIYGWNAQPKESLSEWIIGRLSAGCRIPGFADAIFAPLMAHTLSEVIISLVNQGRRGTYHAASMDAVSKYDFARLIADIFELDGRLIDRASMKDAPARAQRPMNTALNGTKLREETGLALPWVREDLCRLRQLRDDGYAADLKQASSHS
jgi:dTDP-4-dehydrorhamnose reductase